MQRYLHMNDKYLIEQIKQYEPSFNYEQWKRDIEIKKAFLLKMKYHPLLVLYDKIKEESIDITFDNDKPRDIYIDEDHTRTLISILKKNNYTVQSYEYDTIISNDAQRLRKEMILIWLYKEGSNMNGSFKSTHNYISADIEKYGLQDVVTIANTLHIPDTLSLYLKWIEQRYREEQLIKNHKLYSLYKVLEKYAWYMLNRKTLIIDGNISIEPIKNELSEQDILIKIDESEDGSIFHCKDIRYLIQIDRFYHPYIVQWYDIFY